MISKNLLRRLKRLEGKFQRQCEPEMKPADVELIQRLYNARRRMALLGYEGYEAIAPGSESVPPPEIPVQTRAQRMVETLHAGRQRSLERAQLESENSDGLVLPSSPSPDIP